MPRSVQEIRAIADEAEACISAAMGEFSNHPSICHLLVCRAVIVASAVVEDLEQRIGAPILSGTEATEFKNIVGKARLADFFDVNPSDRPGALSNALIVENTQSVLGRARKVLSDRFTEVPRWQKFLRRSAARAAETCANFCRTHTLVAACTIAGILAVVGSAALVHSREAKKKGVRAEYYSDQNFAQLFFTEKVSNVDSKFTGSSFIRKKIGRTSWFSVRFTSFLFVPKDGAYEFFTYQDDRASVWLDGALIIEAKNYLEVGHAALDLKQGFHLIKVEYVQNDGPASIRLCWSKDLEGQAVIGKDYFYLKQEL